MCVYGSPFEEGTRKMMLSANGDGAMGNPNTAVTKQLSSVACWPESSELNHKQVQQYYCLN